MRRLFTMMASQVQSTAELLRHWWSTLSPDPSTWVPFTWVLAALVLVILLTWMLRPRRSATARRPELLISHGELRVRGAAASVSSSLHAPDDVAFVLSMTVSNLSAVPVQLLELAVRTNGSSAPTTADVPAVLPPHGAVEVTAELREAGGDEGTLELFVYVPDMRPKTFRVRARLLWEPWNARFRVLPLDQKVEPARGLTERGLRRREAERRPQTRGAASRRPVADGRAFGSRPREAVPESEVRFEPRPESARPRSFPIGSPSRTVPGLAPDDTVDLPRDPRSGDASRAAPPARPEPLRDALPDTAPDTPPDGPAYTPPDAAAVWPPRRLRAAEAGPDAARPDAARPESQRRETERTDVERREAERREAERRDAERRDAERQEAERERARREAERVETERRQLERTELERTGFERTEFERREAQRAESERMESERREVERRLAERERAHRERRERERAERERAERERAERERAERERAGPARSTGGRAEPPMPGPGGGGAPRPDAGPGNATGSESPSGEGTQSGEDGERRPRLEFPDEF